jgi:hypothetical protein
MFFAHRQAGQPALRQAGMPAYAQKTPRKGLRTGLGELLLVFSLDKDAR